MGVTDGTVLEKPLIEFCYKKDELDDPLIAKEHIFAFNWATEEEIKIIEEMTFRINDFMSGMFRGIGIKLVDFKLEFGRIWNNDQKEVILADEINRTPPKTQAALLEAMQERSVTVAGTNYPLSLPYFVLATQFHCNTNWLGYSVKTYLVEHLLKLIKALGLSHLLAELSYPPYSFVLFCSQTFDELNQ